MFVMAVLLCPVSSFFLLIFYNGYRSIPFIAIDLCLEAYFKHSRRHEKRRRPSRLFFAARSTIVEVTRQAGGVPEVIGTLARVDVTFGILCCTRLSGMLRRAMHSLFQ